MCLALSADNEEYDDEEDDDDEAGDDDCPVDKQKQRTSLVSSIQRLVCH